MQTLTITRWGPLGTQSIKLQQTDAMKKDGLWDIYIDNEWIGSRRTIKQAREEYRSA